MFNNLPGALFEARDDAFFTSLCCVGTLSTFNNFGTFRKTGGTGATTFLEVVFQNQGSVELLSGRLNLTGGSGTNRGPVQLAAGTALELVNGTYHWAGGAQITGNGAVFNNLAGGTFEAQGDTVFTYINMVGALPTFNNAGVFRKGNGATIFTSVLFTNSGTMMLQKGTVSFNGSAGFTQSEAGTLSTDIAGLTAGTDFGWLTLSGPAALAGALTVNLIDGYEPNLGDAFAILSFGSRAGQFGTVNGLAIGNGKQFQASYGPTALTLTAGPAS